jgi:hypothetical protein
MVVSVGEVPVATRLRIALAEERLRDALRAIVCDMLDQRLDDVFRDDRRRLAQLVGALVEPAAAAALHRLESDFDVELRSIDASLLDRLDQRWRWSVLGVE